VVNLGPTEAHNFSIINTEKETSGIKPRLMHSVLKICHRPIALIGMDSKDFIVEI
jgi:hypothetical protein